MSSRDKIIDFLKNQLEPVPPLVISKEVYGKKGTKKMINPELYALQREGILQKVANKDGTKPLWSLKT